MYVCIWCIYMVAGTQYQIYCNNVVISNLVDITTQWLSTVGQFYRGKFTFRCVLFHFRMQTLYWQIKLCEETFIQTVNSKSCMYVRIQSHTT